MVANMFIKYKVKRSSWCLYIKNKCISFFCSNTLLTAKQWSGGELLEIRLLDNHLLDTFGSKSTARHKIYQLLESS